MGNRIGRLELLFWYFASLRQLLVVDSCSGLRLRLKLYSCTASAAV